MKYAGKRYADGFEFREVTDQQTGSRWIVYYNPDNLRNRRPIGHTLGQIQENIESGKWVKIETKEPRDIE